MVRPQLPTPPEGPPVCPRGAWAPGSTATTSPRLNKHVCMAGRASLSEAFSRPSPRGLRSWVSLTCWEQAVCCLTEVGGTGARAQEDVGRVLRARDGTPRVGMGWVGPWGCQGWEGLAHGLAQCWDRPWSGSRPSPPPSPQAIGSGGRVRLT